VSLIEQAAADLRAIMGDTVGGFSVPIRLIAPDDQELTLNGLANDIGLALDPETGIAIAGSTSTVALPLAVIDEAGIGRPRAIASKGSKPWRVILQLPSGGEQTFKVTRSQPDNFGCVVCFLETYEQAAPEDS
jgi:hypothetical protein